MPAACLASNRHLDPKPSASAGSLPLLLWPTGKKYHSPHAASSATQGPWHCGPQQTPPDLAKAQGTPGT